MTSRRPPRHNDFALRFLSRLRACAVGVGVTALGLAAMASEKPPAQRYQECIARIQSEPREAFEDAIGWRDLGGGPPAEHCAARALVALGLYEDAATRLEDLARKVNDKPSFKARLLGQAAQSWLLAGLPAQAETVATAGLKLSPRNPELLTDRAQARAARGNYATAAADLDAALAVNPNQVDALIFRASARRILGNRAGAMADAEAALTLHPNQPDALLERGILKRLDGDIPGARADWLAILSVAPNAAAADLARANLEKMDVTAN